METNNLILASIIIVFCSFGYYGSYICYKKEKLIVSIFFLVVCGLLLRLFCSFDFYLHSWDERFHALVAKNLLLHPLMPTLYENPLLQYDFKDWTANHVWVHKQPFTLWTISLSFWVFGCNEIALRLPSIILSSIGIGLTYITGKYLFNKYVGYMSAFFYSINGLVIEICTGRVPTDHVDTFFMFFIHLGIVLCIYFCRRKKVIFNILSGVSMGIAILCKWLPALIIIPIWMTLVIDSKNLTIKQGVFQFIIFISTATIIALPWQFYSLQQFPLEQIWEFSYNSRHLFEAIEEHSGSPFYFLNKIRINYGELIYLPLIFLIYIYIKDLKNFKILSLVIWIIIPLVFFSFAQTKMQGYILFIAPALFIATSVFIEFLFELSKRKSRSTKLLRYIPIIIIALSVRYSIERIKPFSNRIRNPKEIVDIKKLNEKFDKGVLFNYSDPISAMFYTNLIVYPFIPDETEIIKLHNQGYQILVNNPSADLMNRNPYIIATTLQAFKE